MPEAQIFKERRAHDRECGERLAKSESNLKSWVGDKICISKKDIMSEIKTTKAKQVLMWTIMSIMLSAALTSAYKSVSSAQDSNTTHVRNTSNIQHNKSEIEEVKKDHDILVTKVHEMESRQIKMYGDVRQILGILKEATRND